MKTQINGNAAEWTAEILDLFTAEWNKRYPEHDINLVTYCNYFRPRPYVDEYNRGSEYEGFCYTMTGQGVCLFQWTSNNAMSLDEWNAAVAGWRSV